MNASPIPSRDPDPPRPPDEDEEVRATERPPLLPLPFALLDPDLALAFLAMPFISLWGVWTINSRDAPGIRVTGHSRFVSSMEKRGARLTWISTVRSASNDLA